MNRSVMFSRSSTPRWQWAWRIALRRTNGTSSTPPSRPLAACFPASSTSTMMRRDQSREIPSSSTRAGQARSSWPSPGKVTSVVTLTFIITSTDSIRCRKCFLTGWASEAIATSFATVVRPGFLPVVASVPTNGSWGLKGRCSVFEVDEAADRRVCFHKDCLCSSSKVVAAKMKMIRCFASVW